MTTIDVPVYNQSGEQTEEFSIDPEDLGEKIRIDLLHQYVVSYLANQRQGNASTKDRGEVAYNTKKPWPQKSTGRARAGTRRSPIWVGGGITFGAKPRDYSKNIPKKMKKRAFQSALLSKIQDDQTLILEELSVPAPKTKRAASLLENLEIEEEHSTLLLDEEHNRNVFLATRNLPEVNYKPLSDTNPYEILNHDRIVVDQSALESRLNH